MLTKLALRNAKRSLRDYLIYFITVIISFTMIISYNIVIFSKQVSDISNMMNTFKLSVICISIIVVLIIGWLIFYITNFMLDKRAKEFGLYMTLGIEQIKIRRLFTYEFMILNVLSLLISFLLSIPFSNFLTTIIENIFEYAYIVKPNISFTAIFMSILYFAIVNLYIGIKLNRKIKKQKIRDLLYIDRMNESKKANISKNIVLVIFFIILGLFNICYFIWMFSDGENNLSFIGILITTIIEIIIIYGFTFYISDIVTYILLKNKKIKYTKDNLFVIRQFSSKVKTVGMTLGTISVLVLATIINLNVSNLFEQTYKNIMNLVQPYEITVFNLPSDNDFSSIYNFAKEQNNIGFSVEYSIYTNGEMNYPSNENKYNRSGQKIDYYIKLSEYNKLLKGIGQKEIQLNENDYIIHSDDMYKTIINKYLLEDSTIIIDNNSLKFKKYIESDLPQCFAPDAMYIIIVNDNVIDNMTSINNVLCLDTVGEISYESSYDFYDKFDRKRDRININGSYENIYSYIRMKQLYKNENNTMIITITFCLIYLSVVFILVIGTIVSVQALYDSVKYKARYKTLNYLGVSNDDIFHSIKKQLKLYYIYPVIYPVIFATFVLITLYNNLFSSYINVGEFLLNMGSGYIVFFSIYYIYYLITYLQYKKNIL